MNIKNVAFTVSEKSINIFSDLGDLLYYLMTEYQDIDVQDKARFYYALLTGAADKKVFTPIG